MCRPIPTWSRTNARSAWRRQLPAEPTETFDDVFCSNNIFDGGLRQQGDIELEALVSAIKASPVDQGEDGDRDRVG